MDEYLQEFTQKIINDAEAEVEQENKKDKNAECIKEEMLRKRETKIRDARANSVNGGFNENKTEQNHNCVAFNTPAALTTPPVKKKKRRAPPPPVTNQATSLKEPGKEMHARYIAYINVGKKRVAPIPQQNAGQINGPNDEEMKVKSEAQMSDSEMSMGSTTLEESASDLSLTNPFHPQYEMHMGQLQKHASLSSINVSESCSEFSLSNPFHTRYDELTGTGSLTESESELSLSNPLNPHYKDAMKATNVVKEGVLIVDKLIDTHTNEPDELAEQAVKGKTKTGLIKRVKRLFTSLIPCLRKNAK